MKRSAHALLGLSFAALSCGGGSVGHVEISGKSPAEAGSIVAHALCTHEVQCGDVSVSCTGGGSAGVSGSDGGSGTDASAGPTLTCMGVIAPVVYAKCFADTSSQIARLLTCAMLTADQTNTLETCFDMIDAKACTTQAEADAQASAIASAGPPVGHELPAACAVAMNLPPNCP